jgi:protocatechuate 3,4-dioxygenase beta subunit
MIRGILLAGALCAFAMPVAFAQTGTVQGTVVDSATAAPLPLVRVELQNGAVRSVTMTDEHGRFRLRNVPPGMASVRVTRIGYRPAALSPTVAAGRYRSTPSS